MENNNIESYPYVWFVFDFDFENEKKFFIISNLETPKEYSEVWKDTKEYKEKKFREYLKDNPPFDEGLYCLLRNFNEYDWFFFEEEKEELHKRASEAEANDDELPF